MLPMTILEDDKSLITTIGMMYDIQCLKYNVRGELYAIIDNKRNKVISEIEINQFQDNIEIEELIERLLLIDKIVKRKIESDKNKTISEAELDNEIKEWLN